MSIARNQRRLDRRAARLPVAPSSDPEGRTLANQLLHLISTSTCSDTLKLAIQVQVLGTSIAMTSLPGREQEHADRVLAQLKDVVEACAARRFGEVPR